MTPIELRRRGYQALVEALGEVDAIRFLQEQRWGCDDYTKEQKPKLANVTREEFWQDIQRIRARKKDPKN